MECPSGLFCCRCSDDLASLRGLVVQAVFGHFQQRQPLLGKKNHAALEPTKNWKFFWINSSKHSNYFAAMIQKHTHTHSHTHTHEQDRPLFATTYAPKHFQSPVPELEIISKIDPKHSTKHLTPNNLKWRSAHVPWSKVAILEMVIPPLIGILIMGI